MKTYIKPLMREHHVFSSSCLLSGSPGKTGSANRTLTDEQGLVHNQFEQGLQQLTKEYLFSDFMPCNDERPTFKSLWDE